MGLKRYSHTSSLDQHHYLLELGAELRPLFIRISLRMIMALCRLKMHAKKLCGLFSVGLSQWRSQ